MYKHSTHPNRLYHFEFAIIPANVCVINDNILFLIAFNIRIAIFWNCSLTFMQFILTSVHATLLSLFRISHYHHSVNISYAFDANIILAVIFFGFELS